MYGSDIKYKRLVLTADTAKYVSGFSCGGIDCIELNQYLLDEALEDENNVTYLYVEAKTKRPIAYASLSCSLLSWGNSAPPSPAVLIDKFAVDEKYQGMRFSALEKYSFSFVIFQDLLLMISELASHSVGAKYVVLYATSNKAHHFYEKCFLADFDQYMVRSEDVKTSDCRPMYYRLNIQNT